MYNRGFVDIILIILGVVIIGVILGFFSTPNLRFW